MPVFECNRCHRSFNRKYNLERHENKKNKCKEIDPKYSNIFQNTQKYSKNIPKYSNIFQKKNESSNTNNNGYICDFCNRSYKQKFNLNKHLKTCKIKKQKEEDKKKEILNLEIKLLELKKEANISNTTNNISNITNNHNSTNNDNSTNNTININNNIILNDYGKETIDFLKSEKHKKLIFGVLQQGLKGIQNYISYKYCNPDKPENMTIKYTNQRSNKLKIREDNKWKIRNKKDVLEELYDRDKNVEEVLNVYEHINELNEDEQMDKIQVGFLNMIEEVFDNDDEIQINELNKAKSGTLDDLYNCYAENKDMYK